MEESEKRRERLQAMRKEAASHADADLSPSPCSSYSSSTPPLHLSNPLAHPVPPPTAESTPPQPPRFDFYTDPMSAFSGSKRSYGRGGGGGYNPPEHFSSPIRSASPMSHLSPNHSSAGPRNYHMATPSHQFQVNQVPDRSPYEMRPVHQSGSWRSPVPFATPFSGPGSTLVSSPGAWNQPAGSSGPNSHPNSSWGGFTTPGFGRGGSPMSSSSGRGGSPHNFSGRGRGWWSGGSASPGRSGGRSQFSARRGGEQFYIRTMVKDPWRKLKPVVGNILGPLGGRGSWLQKSFTAKKPRISEGGNAFKSRSSNLAEYLASSFEEAINDADA